MSHKRGQNEGSIYKRRDGHGEARLELNWQDGKHKRKCFYGGTGAEVQEALTSALQDAQQGVPLAVEHQTVGQFQTHWLVTTLKAKASTKELREFRCARPASHFADAGQSSAAITESATHTELAR